MIGTFLGIAWFSDICMLLLYIVLCCHLNFYDNKYTFLVKCTYFSVNLDSECELIDRCSPFGTDSIDLGLILPIRDR